MATLSKPFTFSRFDKDIQYGLNINLDDIISYINARNAGTAIWEFVKADRLVLTPTASDPGSPSTGEIWFNSTTKQFCGYDGVDTHVW